jgi:hypothetical protein
MGVGSRLRQRAGKSSTTALTVALNRQSSSSPTLCAHAKNLAFVSRATVCLWILTAHVAAVDALLAAVKLVGV